jgi:CBS domain-containing protein/sporulation protein YlmC with PRC-barrel domain
MIFRVSAPDAWQRRLQARAERVMVRRSVREALVSLAGLLGRPVLNQTGDEIGRLLDVVCRWSGETYPPVTGLVVKVGRRSAFVPADAIAEIEPGVLRLSSAKLDLRDFQVREGEVRLAHDVLDHQLVDVDGVRVIRASDLYLARVEQRWCLVGAETGLRVLLRRIGPASWRARPAPEKVIDWAAIQALGGADDEGAGARQVRLRTPNVSLQTLRPAELANLLEELGRGARNELLAMVEPATAADALEEMEPDELDALLREAPTEQAAALVERMEPDEAAEALRELPEEDQRRLLAAMSSVKARELTRLLGYPEDTAGGLMTSLVLTAPETETVREVRQRLREQVEHIADLDAICVVDAEGRLLDDVAMGELLLADPDTPLGELVGPPWPITVRPEAPISEVVQRLTDCRRPSLVVVDEQGHPIGRILADDVVDALVAERGWFRVFRLVP